MKLRKSKPILALLSLSFFLVTHIHTVSAQHFKENFIDTTDNAVDVSNFLNSVSGFLPVPAIITEPAVGYGGGLGILYFHKKKEHYEEGKYGLLPPVMSLGAGGITANGTYFGMLGHIGSYKKDRFRYVGIFGMTNVNLSFFGTGNIRDELEYKFNMKGWFTFHEFLMRINRNMPFFVGANYVYFDSNVKLNLDTEEPILGDLEKGTSTGGLNAAILWDSRDNTFTPNQGILAAMEFGFYDKIFGGENSYKHFNLRSYGYTDKILRKTVAGLRFTTQAKWGDPAFYELPYISLRGVPVMRYQDNMVSLAETEWRYNIWKRWSLIGFGGVGITYPDFKSFTFDTAKANYGGGFRYYLAKQYRMHAGLDIARGPESWAWYIVVGSSWLR